MNLCIAQAKVDKLVCKVEALLLPWISLVLVNISFQLQLLYLFNLDQINHHWLCFLSVDM